MKRYFRIAGSILLPLLVLSAQTRAEDKKFVVDEADTLNFEDFHKKKEGQQNSSLFGMPGAAGVIRKGENAFHPELDNPGKKIGVTEENLAAPGNRKPASDFNNNEPPYPEGVIRNIRVRYALYNSDDTPLHAHDAVPVLHSYIDDYCPKGWIKLAEWSLPVEQDHYLYYQFQCLETKPQKQ